MCCSTEHPEQGLRLKAPKAPAAVNDDVDVVRSWFGHNKSLCVSCYYSFIWIGLNWEAGRRMQVRRWRREERWNGLNWLFDLRSQGAIAARGLQWSPCCLPPKMAVVHRVTSFIFYKSVRVRRTGSRSLPSASPSVSASYKNISLSLSLCPPQRFFLLAACCTCEVRLKLEDLFARSCGMY